ncbi:MAG: hypothetical protein ACE5HX_03070 [bacterium]
MCFSNWITFDGIAANVPATSGLFQIKVREGLLTYPQGKSAMFYYGLAVNLSRGLQKFRHEILPLLEINEDALLIRWLLVEDIPTRFQNHLNAFLANFGTMPLGNEMLLHKRNQSSPPPD